MARNRSVRSMLNEEPIVAAPQGPDRSERNALVTDKLCETDAIRSACTGYRGQWNNLALANLDFKHMPSQLIASTQKQGLRVGDVCVRLLSVVSKSGDFSSIVDLYNTYVAKGSSLLAKMCLNNYTGTEELYVQAIPIHKLVSEWNKSLHRFHDTIRCDALDRSVTARGKHRLNVIDNVTQLALSNVPILTDHLWFVLHCIVSRPCLVQQVIQLVGTIASGSCAFYHTGETDNVTVERDSAAASAAKLYLTARAVPAKGCHATVLGDEAGATLGLVWVADEEELHRYLAEGGDSYYMHVGTEAGNTFRCNGFSEWLYYEPAVFARMTELARHSSLNLSSAQRTALAGNTADSARALNRATRGY